jgi:hypothetical protein
MDYFSRITHISGWWYPHFRKPPYAIIIIVVIFQQQPTQRLNLGGGIPTPLKNMKVSWDYYSQLNGTIKKCFKPPTQITLHAEN